MSQAWADRVAGGAKLPDRRRNKSLSGILLALLQHRQLSWSQALGSARRQAAGSLVRLVLSLHDLLWGAYQETARRCAEHEEVILSLDKSAFNLSGLKQLAALLGNLGSGAARGLWAISGLALTSLGEPLGLLYVKLWARPDDLPPAAERPYHERESYCWEEAVKAAVSHLRPGQKVLVVADREADIFEFLNQDRPEGVDLLVRCAQGRKYHDEGCVDPAVETTLQGIWSHPVGQLSARRCGSRNAVLSLYLMRVELCSPKSWPAARRCRLAVSVLAVREEHPPPGVEPLCWVLVTTRQVFGATEALALVQAYGRRWRIETLHETIKREGCRIETLQLRDVQALQLAMGLYYVVGCRAMELCYQAREHPEQPAAGRFDDEELAVLAVMRGGPVITLGEAVWEVAKLGGWEGYPSSQPYGPRTVQRGLEALATMVSYRRAEREGRCDT